MVINPTTLDAYIAQNGLAPQLSDSEWETILQRVADSFGRKLRHRCRLIHQAEDAFRRYSTVFPIPDAVPKPYRYIHYLEFIAIPSPQLSELQQWLTARSIVWLECRQFDDDAEQEEIVGLQIFGYDPDHAA